jgi:hypothetical protein
MVTRRQGAPLLRGALAAGLASQRGEDAAQWVAGWSVPSLPLAMPFPALPGGSATARLTPRLDGRG